MGGVICRLLLGLCSLNISVLSDTESEKKQHSFSFCYFSPSVHCSPSPCADKPVKTPSPTPSSLLYMRANCFSIISCCCLQAALTSNGAYLFFFKF